MKKPKMINLRQLTNVNVEFPSTKADLYNVDLGKPRSVSMPLFLYYAARAKIVKSFYKSSEALLNDNDVDLAFKANMIRFINLAIRELDNREDVVKGAFSGMVQASLFKWILESDTDIVAEEFAMSEKVTINPGKGYSVITVPYFIYNELISFMGTERNARITIIRVCQELQPKLDKSNADEKRTWSRKIHNNLMAKMIGWHANIDVLKGSTPSILDIELIPKHED